MALPLVSVIVPTKNARNVIRACLKSIKNQTYKQIEIILVDNFSKDNTTQIAKTFTKKIFLKGPERSVQRNFGAGKSSGKYIMWIDADMELEKRVVEKCVKELEKNLEIKALVIPEKSQGNGFWARCKALEKQCYLGDERIEGIRFIEKEIFEKVGKMAPKLISGEDWDITTRVREHGYKIGRIKSFIIHNENKLSLIDDLKKKYYYATKSLPYVERHIKGPKDIILFVARPAFFRNWKILLSDPIHAAGLFFMKLCEFGVGATGILKTKYAKR